MNVSMIDDLKNKMWITRKCRIIASERLISLELLSKFLINYYTLVILSISIWSIYSVSQENNHLSFITIIASLFLFGGTWGISSMNFKERIVNLKACYIELDILYSDLEILKENLSTINKSDAISKFEHVRDKYRKILDDVENHSSYDYLKFKFQTGKGFNFKVKVKYYLSNLLFVTALILIIIFPFVPFVKEIY